jgi:hypothetical protein
VSSTSSRLYVQRILDLYRLVPGRSAQPRRSDRRLAAELHDRGVSFEVVAAALLLAVARRSFRSSSAPPLAPIATLHYFRPVIDELLVASPEPGYLRYLRHKLASVAPSFAAALDHQLL